MTTITKFVRPCVYILLTSAVLVWATMSKAASYDDRVRDLKNGYDGPSDRVVIEHGFLDPGSAAIRANQLYREMTISSNHGDLKWRFDSGVKSYTETKTIGKEPFVKKVNVTKYLAFGRRKLLTGAGEQGPAGSGSAGGGGSPAVESKVWIHHLTKNPIYYTISRGGGAFEKFTVEPGKNNWHSAKACPASFVIRFDTSFASGYQEPRYNLTANSHNDFKLVKTGLDL